MLHHRCNLIGVDDKPNPIRILRWRYKYKDFMDTTSAQMHGLQMHKKNSGYKMQRCVVVTNAKMYQKKVQKRKIHGYRYNLFLDTNVNEKLWIHKCKHAWKQIQKCMKTKCKDEFMHTNSKIFGCKCENAKMHGLQNVKVFMDTKCKDSWIWAWKQIYMQRCTKTNAKKDSWI